MKTPARTHPEVSRLARVRDAERARQDKEKTALGRIAESLKKTAILTTEANRVPKMLHQIAIERHQNNKDWYGWSLKQDCGVEGCSVCKTNNITGTAKVKQFGEMLQEAIKDSFGRPLNETKEAFLKAVVGAIQTRLPNTVLTTAPGFPRCLRTANGVIGVHLSDSIGLNFHEGDPYLAYQTFTSKLELENGIWVETTLEDAMRKYAVVGFPTKVKEKDQAFIHENKNGDTFVRLLTPDKAYCYRSGVFIDHHAWPADWYKENNWASPTPEQLFAFFPGPIPKEFLNYLKGE